MTNQATKFEAGRVYQMTSVCDSNCHWFYHVERRTAKSVWIVEVDVDAAGVPTVGEAKRFGVKIYNGEEQVTPRGRYSMNPILGARRVVSEDRLNWNGEELNAADREAIASEADVKETPADFIINAMAELSLIKLGDMLGRETEPQTIKFIAAAISKKANG
jgi:hypothetical protein